MAINPLAIGGGVVAAAAVVGGGLYAGGVFGGSDNSGQGVGNRTTIKESRSIKDESETYAGKFGGKFAYYFLSTKGNVNKEMWTKKAKLVTETLDTESFFNEVKDKTGDDKVNALKNKCKAQYNTDTPSKTDKAGAWKEVWKFCSLFDAKPTTIQEAATVVNGIANATQEKNYSNGTDKLGKTHKADLISIFDPANAEFWKKRNEEFKKGDLDAGSASAYFKKDGSKDIKTLCNDAYELASAASGNETETSPTEANLKKYCGLITA